MSNIYIQEPPTSGKVLLKTSAGDIDIELWCREAPKACRNFIQLCMEGYYVGTIFHRVVKDFIVQGGDPNGDGSGGESIYGGTFKDEFHTRLRFNRRGLVAMANSGKDDNGSQFFFTLGETTELQNKHTIFGKCGGDTIYNVLKMADADIDSNERPMYPYKINKTEVLLNPFDDIVPRKTTKGDRSEEKSKKRKKEKGVKNFGLLSFGEEAEEDEAETVDFVQKNATKSKSVHDVIDDPKLSKETIVIEKRKDVDDGPIEERAIESDDETDKIEKAKRICDKLKQSTSKTDKQSTSKDSSKRKIPEEKNEDDGASSSDDGYENELERERRLKKEKRVEEIRNEIKALKKDYQSDKKSSEKPTTSSESKVTEHSNDMVESYLSEQRKYRHGAKDLPKKGDAREKHTLELLKKFKSKLSNIRAEKDGSDGEKEEGEHVDDEDLNSDKWLSHTLKFEEPAPILARDANTKEKDKEWLDISDPRNPINKRKRGEDGRRDKDRHRHRR